MEVKSIVERIKYGYSNNQTSHFSQAPYERVVESSSKQQYATIKGKRKKTTLHKLAAIILSTIFIFTFLSMKSEIESKYGHTKSVGLYHRTILRIIHNNVHLFRQGLLENDL